MSLSFEDFDLLTEESWGIMGISGPYLSSTETQLETQLQTSDFKSMPKIVAVKEPRFKAKKAKKTKKTNKTIKPTKRMEFLRNKGSRWYNKGRFVSIE